MISQSDKKRFRAIAHHLNPVVTVAGNGLSENVMAELNRALDDHELIKVKLNVGDRQERADIVSTIVDTIDCELVQGIGNVAVLYKKADEPDPSLSNILRSGIL